MTDESLLREWRANRDADAFAELVARHGGMVYAASLRVLRDPSLAEDISQECFMELMKSHTPIRKSLPGFLHIMATRRAINHARSSNRRRTREERYTDQTSNACDAEWDDVSAYIDEAIAKLPERLRQPIILRFLEGQTYERIAEQIGVAHPTVKRRIDKGIESVRRDLARKGVTVASTALAVMLAAAPTHALPNVAAASLGKAALAGHAAAGGVATLKTTAVAGGVIAMKQFIAALAAIVAIIFAAIFVVSEDAPEPVLEAVASPPQPVAASLPVEEEINKTEIAATDEPVGISAPSPDNEIFVSGVVFDDQQRPAVEAQVKASWHTGKALVSTDENGAFRFAVSNVSSPSSFRISATLNELKAFPENYDPLPDGLDDLVLTMEAMASVEGAVIFSTGEPIPGARVSMHSDKHLGRATPTETGAFVVSGLRAGKYELSADCNGTRIEYPGGLELKPGERVTGITFTLDAGLASTGLVSNQDGTPLEGIVVGAFYRLNDGTWGSPEATTDESGRYFIQGLPAGETYSVNFNIRNDGYIRTSQQVTMPTADDIDFLLTERPTVSGRVLDAVTGEPITRFRMSQWMGQFKPDEEDYLQGVAGGNLKEHPGGEFSIRPDGYNYVTVAASAPGYAATMARVENIAPGELREDVEIALEPIAPIHGVVVNESGEPVTRAEIYVNQGLAIVNRNGRGTGETTRTNSDGEFTIGEYAGANLTIIAYHDEYAPRLMRMPIDEARGVPIRFVLGQGSRLEGAVTHGGEPLEDGRSNVNVSLSDGSGFMMVDTGADGAYSHPMLHPGEIMVMAVFSEGGIHRYINRHVTILENEATREDFDFDDTNDSTLEGVVLVDGEPTGGIYLSAIVALSNGDTINFKTQTREDGSYRIPWLPAATFEFGPESILIPDQSYLLLEQATLTTQPGQTLQHDIHIETQ